MKRACGHAIGLLLFCLPLAGAAQDPKLVNPGMYEVFFENDEIRIIQVTYQPGQREALHSHPDYVAHVLEGGRLRVHIAGREPVERTVERGQTLVEVPVTHWAENIGDTVVRAVFIEVKQ